MAFDDPVVWILIVVVVFVLFGASRIPKFARAIGEARREFASASQVIQGTAQIPAPPPAPAQASTFAQTFAQEDPLYSAAEKEGIDTVGKSKSEIASELARKLSNRRQ